jgi:hypothetical protein
MGEWKAKSNATSREWPSSIPPARTHLVFPPPAKNTIRCLFHQQIKPLVMSKLSESNYLPKKATSECYYIKDLAYNVGTFQIQTIPCFYSCCLKVPQMKFFFFFFFFFWIPAHSEFQKMLAKRFISCIKIISKYFSYEYIMSLLFKWVVRHLELFP